MVERWRDYKMLRARGGRISGYAAFLWVLGAIFAVIGVIGELVDVTIGLVPMSWFLLAIVASTLSISYWLGWVVAVFVDYKESKK